VSAHSTPGLTGQVKGGGCASKLSPKILDKVLPRIPRVSNANVLVGFDTSDDAGVYRVMYTSSHPIDSQSLVLKIATSVTTIGDNPHFLTFTTRATAGAGAQALVTGFVVGEVLGNPSAEKTILVRAVGPTLAQFGMEGALAAPHLAIYDSEGHLRHPQLSDQEELKSAQQRAGAFPLSPGATDAVQILRLPAGTYTAQVTGTEGNSGLVLLEVYDIPR